MSSRKSLYSPMFEHDGCGIGFVAHLAGERSHRVLKLAVEAVAAMRHRGPMDVDPKTGDGAGVLTQIPYGLFAQMFSGLEEVKLPEAPYGVGMFFLPKDQRIRIKAERMVASVLANQGLTMLAWRPVPVDPTALDARAREQQPYIAQCLVLRPEQLSPAGFENELYLVRRILEKRAKQLGFDSFYIPSFSSRTIVYKGLLASTKLVDFYLDLQNPVYETAMAVFHQRFSTNTFPTWARAQPFRLLSHNGEINTLQANVNWFQARESELASETWGAAIKQLIPVIDTEGSDSAMLDNVLELLVRSGRDLRQAFAVLIPQAWEKIVDLDPALRAFYQYHAGIMEPWDGPAALTFSDGRFVGALLDRNGLRPLRWCRTTDLIYAGSEAGAFPVEESAIVQKGRLGPGEMLALDLKEARLYLNPAIKESLANQKPYAQWVGQQLIHIPSGKKPGHLEPIQAIEPDWLRQQQAAFGYTSEELSMTIKPMVLTGKEPIGSMGDDTSPSPLAYRPRPLFNFFRQRFAQVTNPPIDPLREDWVMSLQTLLGPLGNLLAEDGPEARLIVLESPILRQADMTALEELPAFQFKHKRIAAHWPVRAGYGLEQAIALLCEAAETAAAEECSLIIISDRGVDGTRAPIPALLAVGAVHQHLIRMGLRTHVSLLSETGEAREVHHFATLIGNGANAVYPYLALAAAHQIASGHPNGLSSDQGAANFVRAVEAGLLKILSKMGISTVESYCGAQLFECLGLDQGLVEQFFTGTPNALGGLGLEQIAEQLTRNHQKIFGSLDQPAVRLDHPGFYKFRRKGERHAFSPEIVRALHEAVRIDTAANKNPAGNQAAYRNYLNLIHSQGPVLLRSLLDFKPTLPIPIEAVEPTENILLRFSTGAMSHGSLSQEAHKTLAMAMNRLGSHSNSGEGGENPERFHTDSNSRTKQVASGRFGVTPAYLISADELQIKMAQGSKPGEGGQLPGHKVSAEIAEIRHTEPGVALISPPPHHDIYSIEDLAQLIYDLKQINPRARISVKLVSVAGVGTIAAGVAKAEADVILISGTAGGTGASPLSSIKNAGTPWELGLAETHQTLVKNNLRQRVRLRVDGGLMTGRDVVIAALLGADEFSFGTSALIAEGCLMARACHLNTCPVGIATQREDLRAKFPGTPERVIAFMQHLAREVREILASLGAGSLDWIVGRSDLLYQAILGPEAGFLDLTAMISRAKSERSSPVSKSDAQADKISLLTQHLLMDAAQSLHRGLPYSQIYSIRNTDRAVGAALSGELTRLSGRQGLAETFLSLTFIGSAGQSFGAFLSAGLSFTLIGEANDYVGKGMGGGEIIVFPSENACYEWSENVIAGNTVLYGATGGSLFLAGRAGERFAVRNSGAQAVVEGIGDHGCEYMTGGTVVVLGLAGRNFGAGMTGGRAFVLDEERTFADRYNPELVHLEAVSDGEASEGLQTMIKAHAVKTGSPKASAILTDWEFYRPLFWLVSPREPISVSMPLAAGMGTRQRSGKAYKPIPLLEQSDITEAYAAFLEKTGLQDIRVDVQIRLTAPGDYDQILEHISVHRWFLGEARHEYIKYHEAVMSWIEQVYLPRIQAIHQHGLQQEFPDRTEADLYLWIPEHRPELVP